MGSNEKGGEAITKEPVFQETSSEHETNSTSINDKLDDLVVTSLDIMNEIVRTKRYLEEVIKDGALHLAKARYILGKASVSSTQLPGEEAEPFSALCTIKVEYNSENGIKVPTFTSTRESVKIKGSDPMHWFGVLVTQNLRLAQTQFCSATDITVEIASLQARLDAISSEYLSLKKICKQEE